MGIRAALRNFSDRKLSALHARASQCSLEGSDLNSTHTPVASALTAMPVLNGEKEVKKRKKEREIYSQCHYEQLNEDICPMPSGGQSRDKTQDCVKGIENEMRQYYYAIL